MSAAGAGPDVYHRRYDNGSVMLGEDSADYGIGYTFTCLYGEYDSGPYDKGWERIEIRQSIWMLCAECEKRCIPEKELDYLCKDCRV